MNSPYINRFLQPDTIIPDLSNPQGWNRFSYVQNNPVGYSDPTGHQRTEGGDTHTPTPPDPDEDLGGGGGSNGGGGDSCNEDEICFGWDSQDELCSFIDNYIGCSDAVTLTGMLGTAADFGAFLINVPFMIAADIALLATALGIPLGPFGYGAVVVAYRLVGAPLSNLAGFTGLGLWTVQGLLTGENNLSMTIELDSQWQLKESSMSASISQDTVFSGLNDTLALSLSEPNVATIWSAVGVVYDIGRNPLAPSFSSAPPAIPTVIQPNVDLTYNWQSGSLTGGFSLFPQ